MLEVVGKFYKRGARAKVRAAYLYAAHVMGVQPAVPVVISGLCDLGDFKGSAVLGECYPETDLKGKALRYRIDLLTHKDIDVDNDLIPELFHEFAHLAQQVRGDLVLSPEGFEWLGNFQDEAAADKIYPHSPWEVEAHLVKDMLAGAWSNMNATGGARPWLQSA